MQEFSPIDEGFMQLCLQLAAKGMGHVAPNPLVGCVVVNDGEVIARGYHERYGEAHAEVNALRQIGDPELLKTSTVYVNLEPCSHHGKTPPCADMLIAKGVRRVVVGNLDSNPLVSGKGIEKLRKAGIDVVHGVLNDACRELNKRFFTFHEKKRPYVILKWAQTADGLISRFPPPPRREDNWITGPESQRLVHQWRAEEQAIMVGTNTVLADDPELTTRLVPGPHPLRVTIDRWLEIPKTVKLFNTQAPTLIFNAKEEYKEGHLHFLKIDFEKAVIPQILQRLHEQGVSSLIVEGGAYLLNSFLEARLWDEARVFVNPLKDFGTGIEAPVLLLGKGKPIGKDRLHILHPPL